MSKYLDKDGLAHLWSKIKGHIESKKYISSNNGSISNMVSISYEEYKTLEESGKLDPNTTYYIIDAQSTIDDLQKTLDSLQIQITTLKNSLGKTATSNSYNDLDNKPTIPTKVSQLTNDSGFTTNKGTITGIKMNGSSKGTSGVVDLGTVITDISGKQDKITSNNKLPYSLISGTPTIPTVNNGTLTIQKNGTKVATFTSNQSGNSTANIIVPTITDTYSPTSSNGMSGKAVANAISNIGTGYYQTFTGKNCKMNQSNTLVSLTLPAGTYIIIGTFKYIGVNLRYFFTVAGRSISAHDDAGDVECTVVDFQVPTKSTVYSAVLWPTDKDVTVSGSIAALRIK